MTIDHGDIINMYIKERKYTSYLEIGIQYGKNYKKIECDLKVGVDPEPLIDRSERDQLNIFYITSDDFFQVCTMKFDCIFIDANHSYEYITKDIKNAIKILNPNGVILLHDTQPINERSTVLYKNQNKNQYGEMHQAYITFTMLQALEKTFNCYIIPEDGIGVIDTHFDIPLQGLDNDTKVDKYIQLIQKSVNRLYDYDITKLDKYAVISLFRIGWPDYWENKDWLYSCRPLLTK